MTTEMLPIWEDDTARARKTDPRSSHAAADQSARTRTAVQDAVVWMLGHYGPLTGVDLNHHYRWRARGMGWPVVAFDSPRKRAGELARDGVIVITNVAETAKRGTPAIYALKGES